MSGNARLRVVGLKELRSDLRKLAEDAGWKAELRHAGKTAAEIVAADARTKAGASFTNLAGGRAALGSRGIASIRALATQTSASVAGGGASVPWYGGSDFGSHGAYRQFPSVIKKGRFIYPAIDAKADEVVDAYMDALGKVTRKYFH